MVRVAILALAMCAAEQTAWAACSGASPTRTAANATRAEVLACVNAAASGDTIIVPAGSATWTTAIGLPATKDLTLDGATTVTCTGTPGTSGYSCTTDATNTTLTCANGCFYINYQASHRITGFTMTNGSGIDLIDDEGEVNLAKHFRIDHNRLISTGGWAPIRLFGDANANHPQGIWDHNRFEDVAVHQNGTDWELDSNNTQHAIWAKQTTFGDSTAIVYIEANYWASQTINATDGNYGCRYVARFNTIDATDYWTFEVHGTQGLNRGCQRVEIYNNYLKTLGSGGLSELRGGTGVYFNNGAAAATSATIHMTIDRAEYDEPAGNFGSVRECGAGGSSGNSPSGVDQQVAGQNGWRCRDQVGTSHDTTQWSHSPATNPSSFGAWAQAQRPVYFWNNLLGTGAMPINVNTQGDIENKILAGREFYCDAGGFPNACNNGVRLGTSLPATCTVGQAFWKTNEGEWNSLQSGSDGRLYRCSATNTWTLYYTPYTYPHPWTGGTGPTPPAAPQNLRIITSFLWSVPALLGLLLVWRRSSGDK